MCKSCKTIFKYTQQDTEIDRDGKYVVCPVCKRFITVKWYYDKQPNECVFEG